VTLTTAFDRFQIGDHIVFDKTFDQSQFDAFSSLSGDRNPFHHDAAYAARQGSDERTIVPLHMTLAPLSMIAGMVFPGEPSLYLGHEIRAAKPVHYGETLRYSARIESVNQSHRVLNLRVLALKGASVVLDATMRVQARYADWEFNPLHPIRREGDATALITGGSGEIGQAIAVALREHLPVDPALEIGPVAMRIVIVDRQAGKRCDSARIVGAQRLPEVGDEGAELGLQGWRGRGVALGEGVSRGGGCEEKPEGGGES